MLRVKLRLRHHQVAARQDHRIQRRSDLLLPTISVVMTDRQSELMRLRFLNKDEFAQVVRNTPLVSIDLIIRDPDRCVLVGLRTNEPAKGQMVRTGGRGPKIRTIGGCVR